MTGEFKQLRNYSLDGYRSRQFITWLKQNNPGKEPHHIFGSVHGLKSSDLFVIMVTRDEHNAIHEHGIEDWHIAQACINLSEYVKHLESKT